MGPADWMVSKLSKRNLHSPSLFFKLDVEFDSSSVLVFLSFLPSTSSAESCAFSDLSWPRRVLASSRSLCSLSQESCGVVIFGGNIWVEVVGVETDWKLSLVSSQFVDTHTFQAKFSSQNFDLKILPEMCVCVWKPI